MTVDRKYCIFYWYFAFLAIGFLANGLITLEEKRELCVGFVKYMKSTLHSTSPRRSLLLDVNIQNVLQNVTMENRATQLDLKQLRVGSSCHPRDQSKRGSKKLLICMLARNQAHLVNEFLAFHWVQGVDRFVIYDDHSSDNITDVLHPWIDTEKVTLIMNFSNISMGGRHESSANFQMDAYRNCLGQYAKNFTWVGFIDIDEFITVLEPRCFSDMLDDYRDYGGVSLNWQVCIIQWL